MPALGRWERLLPPALLALIAVCGLLFYLDYTRSAEIGSRPVIGYITYKYNQVQRKFDDQVVWTNLYNNSQLANRDTVRSENYSEARIFLRDGTVINVDANTMIFLELSGDTARVNFQSGAIRVDQSQSDGELEIHSGDRSIRAEGAELSVGGDSDKLRVAVDRGEAQLSDGQSSQRASADQAALIDEQGLRVRTQPARAQAPANLAVVAGGADGADVEFRWQLLKPMKDVRLELSRSREFRRVERSVPVSGGSARLRLGAGAWYWRLKGTSQNGQVETTEPRKVAVIQNAALVLQGPDSDQTIPFYRESPQVQFRWSAHPLAQEYELQIARDRAMNRIVQRQRSASTGIAVGGLDAGEYYWRVETIPGVEGVTPERSGVRRLTLRAIDSLPAPALSTPPDGATLPADENALLTWQSRPEVRQFRVVVSPRADLSSPTVDARTANNFYEVEKPRSGRYYWQVQAADGSEQKPSSVASFAVQGAAKPSEREEANRLEAEAAAQLAAEEERKRQLAAAEERRRRDSERNKPSQNIAGEEKPDREDRPAVAAVEIGERSDWENASFVEYRAYVQRLERRCGPRETPDLLVERCQDSYVTLKLNDRARRDVFFFIRLIGGNLYRRMDAYRYFATRCPPVFRPAREFMERRQRDLENRPEFDEKRSLSNAMDEMDACVRR